MADWDRLVVPYIKTVAARYGSSLSHWDVVNEALRPDDGRADGLRSWRLSQVMGDDYIVEAFRLVHHEAPGVALYCNDYDVEYDDRQSLARRLNVLRALERWLKAGVPVAGFGMQSHIDLKRGVPASDGLRRFLADVADLGVDIVVSEFDISEKDFDLPIAARDQIVADAASRFLDVVLDEQRVRGLVSWGLSDRYSWLLQHRDKRNRGLPYDDALQPTPLRQAIARSLQNAPLRCPCEPDNRRESGTFMSNTSELRPFAGLMANLSTRSATVGVIGLGYVGLPLAAACARAGYRAVGIDVDEAKVRRLNDGHSYIDAVSSQALAEHIEARRFEATADFTKIADCDVIVICVPTPLSLHREPDLCYLSTPPRERIAANLAPGPSCHRWNRRPIPAPPARS